MLRLQRLAGNRAVRRLLRDTGAALAGVEATTRKDVQIAEVNVSDLDDEETFARNAPSELKGVDIKYGSDVPKDVGLRTGLQVIAWDLLDPSGHKPDMDSPFRDNSTITLELSLKRFKGKDGLYRFRQARERSVVDESPMGTYTAKVIKATVEDATTATFTAQVTSSTNPWILVNDKLTWTVHDLGEGSDGAGDWMHYVGQTRGAESYPGGEGNMYPIAAGNIQVH
jgi:hypothetical protein